MRAIQLQQLDEGVEQAMHTGKRVEPRLQLEADNEWLDEALQETFPASDPIPLFHKTSETERQGDESALATPVALSSDPHRSIQRGPRS
jgi:hypothetical protein